MLVISFVIRYLRYLIRICLLETAEIPDASRLIALTVSNWRVPYNYRELWHKYYHVPQIMIHDQSTYPQRLSTEANILWKHYIRQERIVIFKCYRLHFHGTTCGLSGHENLRSQHKLCASVDKVLFPSIPHWVCCGSPRM